MKFLKYLFFLLLIVIIGASIYVATIDGDFQVEDSKVINAPASVIYNEINDLKTWEDWGPWKADDPNIVTSYPEKTVGVGASYSWTGDTAPDGRIETIDAIPNKSITQTMVMETPLGPSESTVYWTFEEVKEGTKVTWGMKGSQSFQDKAYWATQDGSYTQMLKPMFPKGLENINTVIETKMSEFSINVDGITQHSGGYYMYNTSASKISAIGTKMAEMMPQVFSYMQENNIPISGSPMTIYEQWDLANNTAIFSSAIPTTNQVITPNDSPILCGFMPSQKVVKTTLKGDYKNLKDAWGAANAYLEENSLEKMETSKDFEVYRTDPSADPNPANWVTEIYIPIK
ncbi:MAG: AraC family transcriptional regulator [Croceibacter sp.]|nr:AraC family transcriptional regulator [Croceibacter sp.]